MTKKGSAAVMLLAVVGLMIVAGGAYYAGTKQMFPPRYKPPVKIEPDLPDPRQCPMSASGFLPQNAILEEELAIDFERDGVNEKALAYKITTPQMESVDAGLKVLKCNSGSWTSIYSLPSQNGANSIGIAVLPGGSVNGLYVALSWSGAGTVMDWSVVAAVDGGFVNIERTPVLNKVLEPRGYVFMGYNSAEVQGLTVKETIPGYSKNTGRCCPDLPALEVKYAFTGTEIKVLDIKALSQPQRP